MQYIDKIKFTSFEIESSEVDFKYTIKLNKGKKLKGKKS